MEDMFTPIARARAGNPDTSREAAEEVTPRIRELQVDVLKFAAQCGGRGFKDPDMNDFFGVHSSTYRTRRSELVARGLIEDTGDRVGEKGRKHAVWRCTPAGYAKLADLLGMSRAA